MNLRLKKVIACFKDRKIDALIVKSQINITYLTDYPASDAWLLICPRKVFYITDSRYLLEAKKGLPQGIQLIIYNQKRYAHSMYQAVLDLLKSQNAKRLGLSEHEFTVSSYLHLFNMRKSVKLITADNIVEDLREIKDVSEVTKIRTALKIHYRALDYIKPYIKPGFTERQILQKLEEFVRKENVGFSFPPIIASGPNSCFPHARVTDRKLKNNEVVLIDTGIDYKGYKSDLTRMFFLGKIPPLVQKVNDSVREAQRRAIEQIKPGEKVATIDQHARNSLKKDKLDKYFVHSLGHGVGLEIHESPRLSTQSPAILKEGMVITVEPGVYLPEQFGIRIEDMVLVTKKGCEVISGTSN